MTSRALPADDLRSSAALAHALRPAVLRLARRLRQLRDESAGLGSNQLSALAVLLDQGDLTMGQLAVLELVQPPSMTRIVNGLEERGLVTRTPDPDDRRTARVHLTEQGREVLMANRRRRDQWLTVRLADLQPDERELLGRCIPLLERIHAA